MKSKTGRAIGFLMIGTLLSKGLGFVRELAVSYRFGAGDITDAFVLTNNIPNFIFSAIAVAVSINYIPVFVGLATRKDKNTFTSRLINLYLLILMAGCILVILFPKAVLIFFASGLSGQAKLYAVTMLRWVAASAFPIILSGVFQAYSQAEEKFNSTALYGVVVNIVIIATTFVATENTYYWLSIGTVVANLCGMVFVGGTAYRTGYRYSFDWHLRDENLHEMFMLTIPLLIENVSSNLSGIVDQNLASYLASGTISGLGYANILGSIAIAVISSAIITVTFPRNSKLISDGNKEGFELNFTKYAQYIGYILGPISMFMIFDAYEIVKVIFERGAFDQNATKIVAESTMFYAIGTTFAGLKTYLVRGFYAMKETKIPVKIMVFSLICNMVVNVILVFSLQHKGIALSTSLSHIIATELLLVLLKKRFQIDIAKPINAELLKAFGAAMSSGGVEYILFIKLFRIQNIYISVMVNGICFISVYTILLYIISEKFRGMSKEILDKIIKRSER